MGIGKYHFFILLVVPILFSISTPSAFAQTVSTPAGSSVPDCEETNECFLPSEITVDVGATVTWTNDDSAAHTVTSGSLSTAPDSVGSDFDSGLFLAGSLSFNDFYIIMGIFATLQVGFGLLYRKSVKASFKKSYDTFLTSYTYIFFATAVSMHWMSPYFRIVV